MTQYFDKAVEFIFMLEGGYSNHKNDRGGATNFGITQNTYNSYKKKKKQNICSVAKITKEEAGMIYYENYWLASGADKISDFPIALILFDSCVNHGVKTGLTLYKMAGNDKNKFLNLRREKYKKIVQNNPSQKVFLKGWLNRINKLEKYIAENN